MTTKNYSKFCKGQIRTLKADGVENIIIASTELGVYIWDGEEGSRVRLVTHSALGELLETLVPDKTWTDQGGTEHHIFTRLRPTTLPNICAIDVSEPVGNNAGLLKQAFCARNMALVQPPEPIQLTVLDAIAQADDTGVPD